MKKVFIDSDVFVRDLRYTQDANQKANQRILSLVQKKKLKGFTSIFNLLEVCGVLSYNLSNQDLIELYSDFVNQYNVQVLFPADASGSLQYDITAIFMQIQTKQSLGDAQISYVVNRFANNLDEFVSWNAVHFKDKIKIPSFTPSIY